MKVTSAGVIRNEDKPRTGVVMAHSLASWFFDDQGSWIDLGYEEACLEARGEMKSEHPEADDDELDELVSEAMENFDPPYGTTYLIGGWVKVDGRYEVDRESEFAATYDTGSNIVCVEWSRHTTRCHHTSPCYTMADGSGPCGDLDTPGDSVVAYTLPGDYFEVVR